jgi:hypothetical protein
MFSSESRAVVVIGRSTFKRRLWLAAKAFLRLSPDYVFVFEAGCQTPDAPIPPHCQIAIISSGSALPDELQKIMAEAAYCVVSQLNVNTTFGQSVLSTLKETSTPMFAVHFPRFQRTIPETLSNVSEVKLNEMFSLVPEHRTHMVCKIKGSTISTKLMRLILRWDT